MSNCDMHYHVQRGNEETPLYNNSNNLSPLDFLSAYSSSTRYGD